MTHDFPRNFKSYANFGVARSARQIIFTLRGQNKTDQGLQALYPLLRQGDICQVVPAENAYDLVLSWSVFEHLPDPGQGLKNAIRTLRPGGVLYISLHLFTSIAGHHDIRSFTGDPLSLPPWGHLRPETAHLFHPSAHLNKWRLGQWRQLFSKAAPGAREFLEQYEHPDVYGPLLTGNLRNALAEYSDDELLTVNVVYMWRKSAE